MNLVKLIEVNIQGVNDTHDINVYMVGLISASLQEKLALCSTFNFRKRQLHVSMLIATFQFIYIIIKVGVSLDSNLNHYSSILDQCNTAWWHGEHI